MRVCIYCKESKAESAFNREHVSPEAFGLFSTDNLVLDDVCKSCNDFFGEALDRPFARDTLEGLLRFSIGLREGADFKGEGSRSKLHVRFEVDQLEGAKGKFIRNPTGPLPAVTPLPQIGFSRASAGPFDWFALEEMPTREELRARYGDEAEIRVRGDVSWESAHAIFNQRGITVTRVEQVPMPSGRARHEAVGSIGDREFRFVTKVALNFLCAVAGPEIARLPQFDAAREYARRGSRPANRLVIVEPNRFFVDRNGNGVPTMGHYISAETVGYGMVAQVSILQAVRYIVALANGDPPVPLELCEGRFFNLESKRVERMPPVPLTFGEVT